ncbi:MAG: HEAT repeat domain-containing protein [Planctomycetota bacterium]|jgi:HEAT repeat protein
MRLRTGLLLALLGGLAAAEHDWAALVRDLGGADATRRSAAYGTLMREKDPRVIPLLVEALPRCELVGQSYGINLLQAYPPQLTRGALRTLATSKVPYLRLCAAAALHRAGERDAAKVIVKALEADVPSGTLVSMISRLYLVRSDRVQEAVRALLEPKQEAMVIGAALSHAHGVQDEEAVPAAQKLLADGRAGVRAMAAAFLHRFGEEAGAAALAEAIKTGDVSYSDFSRVKSMLSSTSGVPRTLLDALTERIEQESQASYVAAMIDMLKRYRHAKAVPALKRLLDHASAQVAKAAFEALAGMTGTMTRDALRPLLAADDRSRALWAADALRRMDDGSGLPVVLDVLRTGGAKRAEAAEILGGFRVEAAVDPLLAALMDDSASVRSQAFTSLGYVWRTLFPYRRLDVGATGYAPNGTADARGTAVQALRAWWEANRVRRDD